MPKTRATSSPRRYFSLISVYFRYLILYCHMPLYETGGMFFFRVAERVLFGLAASNAILIFWLLTQQMIGDAILVAPLPFVVASFHAFAKEAYEGPGLRVALDETVDAGFERRAAKFSARAYVQPSLRCGKGVSPPAPEEEAAASRTLAARMRLR